MIMVYESDERMPGYERFEVLRRKAPDDFKPLFNTTQALPFRRLHHEKEAMLAELTKRIGDKCG